MSILTDKFLEKYKNKQPNWGFNGLGYIVYKRTYARLKPDGTTEEWWETVKRCIDGLQEIGANYTKLQAEKLFDHVFNLRCNFAGRMLWQLGTDTVRRFGLPSLCNCWYINMDQPESFCFLFEHLMLGGGVGFSVKREHVHELPKIKSGVKIVHKNTKDADFIVPDSREGWVELLRKILDAYFNTGKGFSYSTILIRGYGEKIHGFGGTASGPQILIDGLENICKIFSSREGKKLRSIDVLDICNIIGSIVVAGNVRRTAQIAIGDADDKLFLNAKRWDLGSIPNWRAMSNNTISADNYGYLSSDFWHGYNGNGEAYGIFNIDVCREYGRLIDGPIKNSILYPRKIDKIEGVNPCQPGWATVLTPEGIKKLDEVKIGDIIWSKEGWTKILNKWSTGIKEVYKYRTNASVFYGTENHRVVCEGTKIEVKDAECIDRICGEFKDNLVINPQDVMDGLVIGDGSVHKASNNLVYLIVGSKDQDYLLDSSPIKNLFKCHRPGLDELAYEINTTITSDELNYTYLRKIPDRFLYGSREKVAGFLLGLFSANGSISGNRVVLKASSSQIIEQVQIMLSSLGIRSYVTTNKTKDIQFSNGIYTSKESYDINITSDRNKFYKIIGFLQNYKMERLLKEINETNISHKTPKNTYEIVSKELISEELVYDITVDNKSHTYWTGGCDVSNCAEANLEHGEPCDLAELYMHNLRSIEEAMECSELLLIAQKTALTLPSISSWTNEVVKRNMRIGLGVTGICEDIKKLDWLDPIYKNLRKFDKIISKERGWAESIKLTVVKPSGTLSLLAGCTPGGHPSYDRYFIRRIRMNSSDGLVNTCKNLGCHIEYVKKFDGTEDHSTVVIEFPCKSSDTAIIANNFSALEQLDLLVKLQSLWADQSVSITIYYKKEELPDIKKWLENNFHKIKTISFLLHQDHGFAQAPYESITEQTYKDTVKRMKPLTSVFEKDSGGNLEIDECAGGACPIK